MKVENQRSVALFQKVERVSVRRLSVGGAVRATLYKSDLVTR